MKKGLVFVLGIIAAIVAVGAPTAAAATEFGDNCTANETTEAGVTATLFGLTAAGDPLPLAAPSAGVITKWKLNLVPAPVSIPQTLRVIRQTGSTSVQVVGESAQTITGGSNSFDARIPVQAGDRLGVSANPGSPLLYCQESPGPENQLGIFAGAPAGSSATFETVEAEARVSAFAVIEPDVDGDGYGDETQDKCPQSAAVQAACPVVALSPRAIVKKGLVTILLTDSSQAPVTVSGTVKTGKTKTKLNGGTQVVIPGTIAKFTLLFPKKLRTALKELPKKRSLTLRVNATAPNVVGAPTTKTIKLRLAGQAKPKASGHKKS